MSASWIAHPALGEKRWFRDLKKCVRSRSNDQRRRRHYHQHHYMKYNYCYIVLHCLNSLYHFEEIYFANREKNLPWPMFSFNRSWQPWWHTAWMGKVAGLRIWPIYSIIHHLCHSNNRGGLWFVILQKPRWLMWQHPGEGLSFSCCRFNAPQAARTRKLVSQHLGEW